MEKTNGGKEVRHMWLSLGSGYSYKNVVLTQPGQILTYIKLNESP